LAAAEECHGTCSPPLARLIAVRVCRSAASNVSPGVLIALTSSAENIGAVRGFLVAGHTDAKGGTTYNQKLSEHRAEAVKRFLVRRFDIPEENLVTVGYGKQQLKNRDDPFAAENRRVQVVNLKADKMAADDNNGLSGGRRTERICLRNPQVVLCVRLTDVLISIACGGGQASLHTLRSARCPDWQLCAIM
jgi:OmpA family